MAYTFLVNNLYIRDIDKNKDLRSRFLKKKDDFDVGGFFLSYYYGCLTLFVPVTVVLLALTTWKTQCQTQPQKLCPEAQARCAAAFEDFTIT